MDRKYEKAVKILMQNIGWVWCDICADWIEDLDHFEHYHIKK